MRPALVLFLGSVACTGAEPEDSAVDTTPPTRCEQLGRAERAFVAGSGALNEPAGEVRLPLRSGETWTMASNWSGCDSWVIIPSRPRQNGSFPNEDVWKADHLELIQNSPDNVHYFFVPANGEDIESRLNDAEFAFNAALVQLPQDEFDDWRERVHFVTETPASLGGWLGDALVNPGWGIVIGPDQVVRYLGSFADPSRYSSSVGWFEPNLAKAANEAHYGNFRVERDARLAAEEAEIVPVFEGAAVQGSGYAEVTLPANIADYDTLEFDLTMNCQGEGEFGTCPAWDYLVYLHQCDDEVDAADAYATTSCQPYVPEVMGLCHADGTATETECRDVGACEDESGAVWTCEGHEPAIAADTLSGSCASPLGEGTQGTYTCNADGTGYDALVCPCNTEIGRWITTYHREGRYVHEATPFLALMQDGGTRRYRFATSQPYDLDLDFRFSNRGIGVRPTSMSRLHRGAYYSPTVNESYQPIDVDVPSSAARVELATVVSGHGGGQLNCGEFCRTTNHFTVGGEEVVIEDPWVDVANGCEQQVSEGTVPNQYGTWWYGRNGWCPGKEVPVQRFDITASVSPGSAATFEHATFGPGGMNLNGGSGERIEVESWMVVYE
ncbi:MAG: hypothetical protein EP330_25370 [Deltaproteobacteria bacterium]|nr:MAG: hypothetical protein EP330_25370 [Deltaproteobacteria bacterium]